jgi:hypothetical protein
MDTRGEWGSGRLISEQRSVSGISSVNLATIGRMVIKVADTESLRIEADDNLMPYIKTEVNNGELIIKNQEHINLRSIGRINYFLTVKKLDSIAIYSSGDIEAPDLKAEHFSITIASAGNLDMGHLTTNLVKVNIFSSGDVRMASLNADNLEANICSAGDLDIAGGEVKTQTVALNSSGDYRARNLASDEAGVNLNSTGSAIVRVRNRLNASLNSSGDLSYIGSPMLNVNRHSVGDIIQIGN